MENLFHLSGIFGDRKINVRYRFCQHIEYYWLFFRTVIPKTFGIKFSLLPSHIVEIMHAFPLSYSAEKDNILKVKRKRNIWQFLSWDLLILPIFYY